MPWLAAHLLDSFTKAAEILHPFNVKSGHNASLRIESFGMSRAAIIRIDAPFRLRDDFIGIIMPTRVDDDYEIEVLPKWATIEPPKPPKPRIQVCGDEFRGKAEAC